MHSLPTTAMRWAYLGQHHSIRLSCAAVQMLVRRMIKGREQPVGRAALRALVQRYRALLERDFANAQRGAYPMSLLFGLPVATYAKALPRLAMDLPNVVRRMKGRAYDDLPAEVDVAQYPAYYRRTFHWQSDGYLSRRSAELYDVGVELLFGGTADVMRRQIIPPITEEARRRGRPLRILDVACGTGRTLDQLGHALPDAELTGLDLSPFYIDTARERLASAVQLHAGNAEALPFADHSFDVVTSVYLFHELPKNARRKVVAEMFRVLRPGGLLVLEDSMQPADAGDLAFFADRFADDMHEPFYRDYLRDDLAALTTEMGFSGPITEPAFLSKVVATRRPAATVH
jgi:ubiquinone/menaquinone biosynthesis C-methylase UbiE